LLTNRLQGVFILGCRLGCRFSILKEKYLRLKDLIHYKGRIIKKQMKDIKKLIYTIILFMYRIIASAKNTVLRNNLQ